MTKSVTKWPVNWLFSSLTTCLLVKLVSFSNALLGNVLEFDEDAKKGSVNFNTSLWRRMRDSNSQALRRQFSRLLTYQLA